MAIYAVKRRLENLYPEPQALFKAMLVVVCACPEIHFKYGLTVTTLRTLLVASYLLNPQLITLKPISDVEENQ